jgi:HK97 family phage major capsid protein
MSLTIDGIEERVNAIKAEMEQDGADINALDQEMDAIAERRNAIKQEAETRKSLADKIAKGEVGKEIRTFEKMEEKKMENEIRYNVGSPEYRTAWLKNMAVRGDGTRIFGELTEVEQRAFTMTTENAGAAVPVETANKIIDIVESEAPMLADAEMSNMARGFGVPRLKAITAGDAKGVAEGAANDDEQDEFDLLTLDGVEIKKHVVITRKMQFNSIDAFETWLVSHLGKRIRVAKEKLIIARLDGTAPDGGAKEDSAKIDAENVMTGLSYTDAAIRSMFAKLRPAGTRVVYANNATIWGKLVGIVDGEDRKLFVPDSMSDPTVQGRIYGALVKVDPNVPDDVVYVGVKGQMLANNFDDLYIYSMTEPKTANTVTTAYSLFDAGLQDPKGFVKATFTA